MRGERKEIFCQQNTKYTGHLYVTKGITNEKIIRIII